MLVLYDKTESSFISNGLAILNKYCLSAVVREEVNNTFVLNAVFPSKFPHLDKIDYDRIIKAPTPDGEQPFRIYMIRKLFGRVYISAKHVFFDLEDNLIEDTFIQKQTGAGALNKILKSTQFPHRFTGTSDILNTNNSRLVDKNVVTALIGDQDNSFVNRWGGEIEVDKWDIRFNKVRGKDRGIQILYRKNLTGLDAILNKKTVCTRVLVKGYDGLTLPERYIDSPLINNYPNPIIQEVKFSNIKVKENEDDEGFDTKEEALEALREAGKQLFSIDHIDIPETSYTINFVELSKTEEYKKYKILETLWLGDTVTVRHDDLCIDVKARCVAYDFNSLTKKYINIELGKVKDSINKEINKEIDKIQEEINDSKGFLDDAINAATNMINSGLGGYVTKTRDELLIMDTEDKMTASKVWRWNLNGLGFSKNGYLGPFETAITRDGKFVINSVTANKISAAMIEAGVLSSLNNKTWINLENGAFNFHEKLTFDGTNFGISLNNGKTIEEEINTVVNVSKNGILAEIGNYYAKKSELRVSEEGILAKLVNNGGNNLLKNGGFENGLKYWGQNGSMSYSLTSEMPATTSKLGTVFTEDRNSRVNIRSGPGTNYGVIGWAGWGTVFTIVSQDGEWYQINYGASTGWMHNKYLGDIRTVTSGYPTFHGTSLLIRANGGNAGVFQKFSCQPGKQYYCVFTAMKDPVNPCASTTIGIEGINGVNINPNLTWEQYAFQFTATKTEHVFIAYANGSGNFYIDNVMVAFGEVPTGYVDYSGELYTGIVKIDADGQRIDFEDGTYVMMGRDGFKYYVGGSGHTYCSLVYTGSFSVSNAFYGATMGITLPTEFRNKDIKVLVFPVEYAADTPFVVQKVLCQLWGAINYSTAHFTIRYGCHVIDVDNSWNNKDIGMTVGYIALA